MIRGRMPWIAGAIIAGIVGITCVIAACNTTPAADPSPAPTQECIELDGEPCDDDPLDLDDLFEKKPAKKSPCVSKPGVRCK